MKNLTNQEALDLAERLNSSIISFTLTTLEAVLGEENREKQLRSVRKLILDRNGDILRDARQKIAPTG